MVRPLQDGGFEKVSAQEKDAIQKLYSEVIAEKDLQYKHDWQPGDLVVLDNLAVAHRAPTREEHLAYILRCVGAVSLGSRAPLPTHMW